MSEMAGESGAAEGVARRVLFFGFSVTEQKEGFARLLATTLEAQRPGIEVAVAGLGGMHPPEAAHLFDSVVPRGLFDLIVLDLTTTAHRLRINHQFGAGTPAALDGYGMPVLEILAKAVRRRANVLVVNLARSDVDYASDEFTAVCERVCRATSIEFVDLASALFAEGEIEAVLLDEVHSNPYGSKLYADRLLEPVLRLLDAPPPQPHPVFDSLLADHSRAVALIDLVPYESMSDLTRSFSVQCVELKPGHEVCVRLPFPMEVSGVSYVMGPKSGTLTLKSKDWLREVTVDCYDQFCYYNRVHCKMFDTDRSATVLSIAQDPAVPTTPLLKGEKDDGPRLGLVAHLLTHHGAHQAWVEDLSDFWR